MGYEARARGPAGERECFSAADWHAGDVCGPDVWRAFPDKSFDFVVCSHVLEDVRDPVSVCAQLVRVGKAGYIEVPSRFRECAKTSAHDAVAGWEHHRWIVDVEGGTLVFTYKNPWIHRFDFLGGTRRRYLDDPRHQFTAVHWIGSFDYVERSHKGSAWEIENLFLFYAEYPYEAPPPLHRIEHVPPGGRTFRWITDFRLPIEHRITEEQVLARHRARTRRFRPTAFARALRRLTRGLRRLTR